MLYLFFIILVYFINKPARVLVPIFNLILKLLINNCFNIHFTLRYYHSFYVNVELDDFVVGHRSNMLIRCI